MKVNTFAPSPPPPSATWGPAGRGCLRIRGVNGTCAQLVAMEVIGDTESELVLAYRGWLRSPPKLLVPLLVPMGFTLLLLSVGGFVPYPWIVAVVSFWMCTVGIILSHDLHRDFVWKFDRIGRVASYSVVRPSHFRLVAGTWPTIFINHLNEAISHHRRNISTAPRDSINPIFSDFGGYNGRKEAKFHHGASSLSGLNGRNFAPPDTLLRRSR